MATRQRPHTPTTRESIEQCNQAVTRRFGVTLRVYKIIKAVTQLVGVGAGIYAMSIGGEPSVVYPIVGAIIAGPEIMEYAIANGDEKS